MKSKKSQALPKILNFLLIIILLVLIAFASYFLYLNIPRSAEQLDVSIQETQIPEQPLNIEINQFYPNMKFNHNQISYTINQDCETKKKLKMLEAFDELTRRATIITFYPTTTNPDIEISCTRESKPTIEGEEKEHFIAGEGGAKEIIQTERFNIITDGVILLYENSEIRTIECDYPNVELHELMHVFGFDHINNKKSLMYPFIESCNQILDQVLVQQIKELYLQPNLADLYFKDIKAVKRGRYLDFNLTIKNSGAIDSGIFTLTVLDNDKIIEEKDLDPIKFGAGITLTTKNLRLTHLNPDQITFIIDQKNKIEEIDENNNIANIKLN